MAGAREDVFPTSAKGNETGKGKAVLAAPAMRSSAPMPGDAGVGNRTPATVRRAEGKLLAEHRALLPPERFPAWLPRKYIKEITASNTPKEWQAKVRWLIAVLFYRCRFFSSEAIKAILQELQPKSSDILVSTSMENTVFFKGCLAELQDRIWQPHEKLALVFLTKSRLGAEFLQEHRKTRENHRARPRLSPEDLEEKLGLSVNDMRGLWKSIEHVAHPAYWTNTVKRGVYMAALRRTTYALLSRIISHWSRRGKLDNETSFSIKARLADLQITSVVDEPSDWPKGPPNRPRSPETWCEQPDSYPMATDSTSFLALLKRIADMQPGTQAGPSSDTIGGPTPSMQLGVYQPASLEGEGLPDSELAVIDDAHATDREKRLRLAQLLVDDGMDDAWCGDQESAHVATLSSIGKAEYAIRCLTRDLTRWSYVAHHLNKKIERDRQLVDELEEKRRKAVESHELVERLLREYNVKNNAALDIQKEKRHCETHYPYSWPRFEDEPSRAGYSAFKNSSTSEYSPALTRHRQQVEQPQSQLSYENSGRSLVQEGNRVDGQKRKVCQGLEDSDHNTAKRNKGSPE